MWWQGTVESRVGRPPVVINMEDVELLRSFHFTSCQIADIPEVSRSTLYRRIQDEGLSLDLTFTNVTDNELDHHVEAIKRLYPNKGERLMIGHLRSLGIYVPQSLLGASIHRVDPVNTAIHLMLLFEGEYAMLKVQTVYDILMVTIN